jgi:argininosuccinate lyase
MAMWGGRFSENTSKDVADYSESISFDKRLYKYDIQGSKAHATMLGSAGIIPEATAKMICEELDNILERIEKGDFEIFKGILQQKLSFKFKTKGGNRI